MLVFSVFSVNIFDAVEGTHRFNFLGERFLLKFSLVSNSLFLCDLSLLVVGISHMGKLLSENGVGCAVGCSLLHWVCEEVLRLSDDSTIRVSICFLNFFEVSHVLKRRFDSSRL